MDEEQMNFVTDCLKEISSRRSMAGGSCTGSIDDGKRIYDVIMANRHYNDISEDEAMNWVNALLYVTQRLRLEQLLRKENILRQVLSDFHRQFGAFFKNEETDIDSEDSEMNEASTSTRVEQASPGFDPSARCNIKEEEDGQIHSRGDHCMAQEQLHWETRVGRRLPGYDSGETLRPVQLCTGTLEDIVIMYHGICQPLAKGSDHHLSPLEVQKVHKCKILLSCQHAERNGDNPIPDRALVTLVDRLLAQVASQCLTVTWTDLNASSPNFLANRLNKSFRVTQLKLLGSEEHVYSITDGEEGAYELVIGRASAVVFGLRQRSAHTLDDLTKYLCRWGIRLSTSKRVRAQDRPPRTLLRIPERILIPHRLKGFQLKMKDFANYVERRRQLFSNSEVVRAALKHGGLIWRLAMEEASEECVTSGHSPRATETGACLRTTEGEALWDEMLTEDQIDVICGVYKVEREGNCGGELTEHVSWFPKDTSWRGCGLDVGFWSPDAESWYQRRLARYIGGDFKCENQTEWRKSLKLWRDAPKVAEGLEKVSQSFLQCHVLRHWYETVATKVSMGVAADVVVNFGTV
ncbi:uncharacterized protein ARMOST_18057 [Armillaria ostoyae]|uniref:Uncharacterized protein n=1 Tax=Armillaria ostoyae TaxID=47428 RepID=A0A284S0Q8_ARMOS|nr:uncharacterized protein ARMOST_18057 [Armillaria ostoyae]